MRLRTFWATAIVCGLVVAVSFPFLLRGQYGGSSTDKNGMYIGVHADYKNAERLAFDQISEDMHRFPNAPMFHVRWSSSKLAWLHLDEDFDRFDLYYDRKSRRLTHGSNGAGSGWEGVTEDMMNETARCDNPDEVFTRHHCQGWP